MFLFKYARPASSFSKLILINALADKLWPGLSQWKHAHRIMTPYCSKVWLFLVFVFHLYRICSVAASNIGQVSVYTHLLKLFPSWHLCFAKKKDVSVHIGELSATWWRVHSRSVSCRQRSQCTRAFSWIKCAKRVLTCEHTKLINKSWRMSLW